MTAEEFAAHEAGIDANEIYLEEEARAGRYHRIGKMCYDDNLVVRVVEDE